MNIKLFTSKHLDIWFDTEEIGIGFNFARPLKAFIVHFLLLDIAVNWNIEEM